MLLSDQMLRTHHAACTAPGPCSPLLGIRSPTMARPSNPPSFLPFFFFFPGTYFFKYCKRLNRIVNRCPPGSECGGRHEIAPRLCLSGDITQDEVKSELARRENHVGFSPSGPIHLAPRSGTGLFIRLSFNLTLSSKIL